MKRGRGRPPIAFEFSPYWAKRIYRERREALEDLRRRSGKLRSGRPDGLMIDPLYSIDGRAHPLVIPAHRIAEEADQVTETARKLGRKMKRREAVYEALLTLLDRFGKRDRIIRNPFLLETALRLDREYRRTVAAMETGRAE